MHVQNCSGRNFSELFRSYICSARILAPGMTCACCAQNSRNTTPHRIGHYSEIPRENEMHHQSPFDATVDAASYVLFVTGCAQQSAAFTIGDGMTNADSELKCAARHKCTTLRFCWATTNEQGIDWLGSTWSTAMGLMVGRNDDLVVFKFHSARE